MSRFSQYNKNDTYRDNFNYANIQKERRTNENLQEIERDRKAMERLQIELDQEKKLEKERKNQIKQMQYQDYSNYMKQKYAETPQNREKLNIKLGGEQRFIRRPSYNQQMDNLCLNPTKQENIYPITPIQNFSEAGRNYQRGYSHGYNILTGETFSPQGQIGKKTPKNIEKNTNFNFDGYNMQQDRISKTQYPKENINKELLNIDKNKEKEDLNQYQQYMEMKRQKEQEEMYYLQQQEKEKERLLLENKNMNNNIEPNIQSQSNYNEIKTNEIPPEYREMYLRQIEQERQQELQRRQQELPPEYKDMYMKQIEQERQQKEIPPEYRGMYMREQSEQQKNENQIQPLTNNIKDEKNQIDQNQKEQKEEILNEYGEIMQQQNAQKHNRSTPVEVKTNNFINQQNYQNYQNINNYEPKIEYQKVIYKENNNKDNKIPSEEDYKSYLLSQQKDNNNDNKEKEKEDENMEIYQNMLREQAKEKEQLQNNQEREQYLQYLLNKEKQSQINEQNVNPNQIIENPQYQNQYEKQPEVLDNKIPKQEIINEYNNKPINSFEDYYKQKGINIPESQPQSQVINQEININENKYDNYPPYPREFQSQSPLPSQEQGFDEQQYLMYQKQKQMQEMQEMEERERARQILERQQMEKMNINNINDVNDYNQQNEYYNQSSLNNYNSPYNNQISDRKSEYNAAKMEYLQNKQKNRLSKDNIFSVSEIPKPPPKYNNEPLTNADRLRIQREYAQFLDAQINAKSIKNSKNRNNGLGVVQSSGYDVGGPNPYQQLRDKHNKLKDIPQDPYSIKNYNISNNSYLTSNPITNPVNSYKFVDRRRVSSGRLQNNGSNVIGK